MFDRREFFQAGLALAAAEKYRPGDLTGEFVRHMVTSGKAKLRSPVSRADVVAYETTYGVRFSRSFKSFLRVSNGLELSYDFEEVRAAGLSVGYADINVIFGIGGDHPHSDLVKLTRIWEFYDVKFLSFAPAIALGGDFCTLSEISRGKHTGRIMYTDGENFSEFQKRDIKGRSPDDLVDEFIRDGWFMPIADSFELLLANYATIGNNAI